MPQPFDPYRRWLGIVHKERPPTHYELLGVQLLENDVEVIRDATERQLGHLRRYLAGDASDLAQELIAEVTRAQQELLNPTAKQIYDSELRRRNSVEFGFLVREGFEKSVGLAPELLARLTGHGFDPLYRWLGIPTRDQPPTLYRLLGLATFESDVDVIREGAERQIAHIRKYSLGERRAIAETLLRALAGARGQLLDAARKQAYDERLSQLGSVVRRYASDAIEPLTSIPAETPHPVPLNSVSDPVATSDLFELEDFEAIPLAPAQSRPTQTRRRRTVSRSAWTPYVANGCVVAMLVLVLLGAVSFFIARIGSETIAVIPSQPPRDSPTESTMDDSHDLDPATPQPVPPRNANTIELEPPRKGNPLLDYHRLRSQLEEAGVDAVLEEYRNSTDADVQLVEKALDLSKYALRKDSSQLWSQLQARTVQSGGIPLSNFQRLRPTTPHWESLTASFAQAGGPLLRVIKGKNRHQTFRAPIAFSPDGTKLIGLEREKILKVWELSTGKEISSFSNHVIWPQSIAVTPDGKTVVSGSLAAGSGANTLKIWDLATGRELHDLAGHDTNVNVVALAPDGRSFVSGSTDRTVAGPPAETLKVWDIETGRELRTLPGLTRKVEVVLVTPDGKQVVAMTSDAMKVWDLATGAEQRSFPHRSTIPAFDVSRDSQLVAAVSTGNEIQVWNLKSGNEVQTLTGHGGLARAIAFTDDGSQIVTSSLDETVKVWDLQSGKAVHTFSGHVNMASAIAISRDARTIVSAAKGHRLLRSSVSDGIGPITFAHNSYGTTAVSFAPDNQTVVTATGNSLYIWNTLARDTSTRLPELAPSSPVAINPDGSIVAYSPAAPDGYGSNGTTIHIWDTQSSRVTTTLLGHEMYVEGLAFSHDGRTLRSTNRSDGEKFWDVAAGEQLPDATAVAFPGNDSSEHNYEVVPGDFGLLIVQGRETSEPHSYLTILGDHTFAAATLLDDQQTIIAVDRSGAVHQLRVRGLAGQR